MTRKPIELDWTRLLGFDQADPAHPTLVFSAKIGPKQLIPALRAKVGDKGPPPPGIIGRPQELGSAARR